MLHVPFTRAAKEPSLFLAIPEIKNELIKFCNGKVKEWTMSVELALAELKNTIIPEQVAIYNLFVELLGRRLVDYRVVHSFIWFVVSCCFYCLALGDCCAWI